MSRTMIWKGMQTLRQEGLVIEGEAGQGGTPSAMRAAPHTLGWRLDVETFFEECGSTNAEARRLASARVARRDLWSLTDRPQVVTTRPW